MQTFEISGSSFQGYLSTPGSGSGAAILVLHAWWGLNAVVQKFCDELSGAGFVSLALDYYHGAVADSIEGAKAFRQTIDRVEIRKQVKRAIDFLLGHPQVSAPGVGTIGLSLGAGFAIDAARSRPEAVRAVALYYGSGGGKFERAKAAFLGHFAEQDRWGAHAQKVEALAQRIRSAGLAVDFHTYPGTQHWFVEPDRPEYNPQAAALAWQRTIAFFRERLA